MEKPALEVLRNEFAIHRLMPDEPVPPSVLESSFFWVGKTDEELSIVCDSSIKLAGGVKNTGWSCFKVIGPIDLSVTGVLAGITAVLASARINIFAISTYDTDYVLVKSSHLERALIALREAGHTVENP
jgi:hypothetical protein